MSKKRPKTLLLFSPARRQKLNVSGLYPMAPLGIATLAAILRNADYPVKLFDPDGMKMSEARVVEFLQNNSFDHIGFSANLFSVHFALKMADVVRKSHPHTIISLGGHIGVLEPAQFEGYTEAVDLLVRGEGEKAILDIVRAIENESGFDGIPGVFQLRKKDAPRPPERDFVDLNEIPRPAFDLLPLHNYKLHPPFGVYPPGMYLETTRGCPHRCTFCTLPKKPRSRSPQLVIEDIKELQNKYRIREVHFVDPTFTYDADRVHEICRLMIEKNIKIHWTCKTRCDAVDPAMLAVMAKAGCYSISYGVESASQLVLDKCNKEMTVEAIERAITETKKVGIRVLVYLLIGSEGETDETVNETIRMIKNCKPDFALYAQLLPDPASILGRKKYQTNDQAMKDVLDYYLAGKDGYLDETGVNGFPAEKIEEWISRGFKDFYMNPLYIIRRLLDVRSIHDFINLFRGAVRLIADRLGVTKTVG